MANDYAVEIPAEDLVDRVAQGLLVANVEFEESRNRAAVVRAGHSKQQARGQIDVAVVVEDQIGGDQCFALAIYEDDFVDSGHSGDQYLLQLIRPCSRCFGREDIGEGQVGMFFADTWCGEEAGLWIGGEVGWPVEVVEGIRCDEAGDFAQLVERGADLRVECDWRVDPELVRSDADDGHAVVQFDRAEMEGATQRPDMVGQLGEHGLGRACSARSLGLPTQQVEQFGMAANSVIGLGAP